MSRPLKDGVDYFPLDVRMDDKMDLIEAEFGLTGFAVVLKLYQKIYEFGYYCEWTDEVALLFGKRIGLPGDALPQILNSAIKRGIFDSRLFDKYRILTSVGIQRRYFEAVSRRKTINVDKRYLLVEVTSMIDHARINWINVDINPVNDNAGTQSKLKETRVKEIRVMDAPDGAHTCYAEFVTMSEDEYSKLVTEHGEAVTSAAIERLNNYKGSTGKKYKNDYRAILSWVIGDLRGKQPILFGKGEHNGRPDGQHRPDYGTHTDAAGVERTGSGHRVADPDTW